MVGEGGINDQNNFHPIPLALTPGFYSKTIPQTILQTIPQNLVLVPVTHIEFSPLSMEFPSLSWFLAHHEVPFLVLDSLSWFLSGHRIPFLVLVPSTPWNSLPSPWNSIPCPGFCHTMEFYSMSWIPCPGCWHTMEFHSLSMKFHSLSMEFHSLSWISCPGCCHAMEFHSLSMEFLSLSMEFPSLS